MGSVEPYANWELVGSTLGVALLLAGGAAMAATLWLVRHVPPRRQRRLILLVVAVAWGLALVFYGLWLAAPAIFFGLTRKEGPMEFLTLPVLLMAAAVFLDGARTGRLRFWGYPWGAACVLLVLEEIDWGQLIFGFKTPAWVLRHSGRSTEVNFHNTSTASVVFFLGIAAVFIALPLGARARRLAPLFKRWGLRPPPGSVIATVLLTVLVINPVGQALGIESSLQEVTELCLALMLWAYGLHWWWAAEAAVIE